MSGRALVSLPVTALHIRVLHTIELGERGRTAHSEKFEDLFSTLAPSCVWDDTDTKRKR